MLNSAHLSASSINQPFNKYVRASAPPRIEKTMHKASGYSKHYDQPSEGPKHETLFDRKAVPTERNSPKSHLKYSSSSDFSTLDLAISSESEMASPLASDGSYQPLGRSNPFPSSDTSVFPQSAGVSKTRLYSPMFIQDFSSPFNTQSRLDGSSGSKVKKDPWSSDDYSDISPPQLSLDFLESGKAELPTVSTPAASTSRRLSNPQPQVFHTDLTRLFQKDAENPKLPPPVSHPLRHDQLGRAKETEPKRRNLLPQLDSHRSDQRRLSRYEPENLHLTRRTQAGAPKQKQGTDEDFASCLCEINRLSLATKRDQDKIQDTLFGRSRLSSTPVLAEERPKLDSPRIGSGSLRDLHEAEPEFQDSQSSESDEDSESSLLATQPLPNLNSELEEENSNPRSWQAKRGLLAELYKTEICLNWLRTRNCSYGNKCHYAHGIADLRARQRIETYKTQPCADPARKGCHICMYTTRCNYAHPGEPIRRMGPHSGKKYFDHEYFEALRKSYPYHEMPFGVFV